MKEDEAAGYRNHSPSPVSSRPTSPANNPFTANNSSFNNIRAQSPPPPTPRHNDAYELQPPRPPAALDPMDAFLVEIDQVRKEIANVNNDIDAVERLHNTALASYNDDQWQYHARELEQLQESVRAQNATIKNRITAIERTNAQSNNPGESKMRRTQSENVRKRFLDTIRRYQEIESDYRHKYRQRVERQIRIVKPEATEEEVDRIMDSDQGTQVFTQSIIQAGRQGASRAVLSEVQNRHIDIKRIERTLVELHQLFQDMHMLVEQQGDVLVKIDDRAQETAGELKEGNSAVKRAVDLARSTRGKKWCCLVLVIILCVVIAILVWWFAFDHVFLRTRNMILLDEKVEV
ncbi:t-SNARE [Zychaea mexicana]|uniref:t-SNARE n=1 Tax=Zychaea mexicana TaxID=64656 RepID=UPI0022FE8DB1|nr:t-SNARE [Zychaea mexicana]KAI9488270.1 t-SNARE [Zychaea mexicana]